MGVRIARYQKDTNTINARPSQQKTASTTLALVSAPFHHLASKVIGSEKSWNKDYIIRVN